MLVADGKTATRFPEKPKCKKLVEAGAVRLLWPADKDREEPEQYTWNILQEANWNEDTHLGWRFTKEELAERRAAAAPPPKRRK